MKANIKQSTEIFTGSAQKTIQEMWVYEESKGLVLKKINFVEGLYKIFDGILVNAADNPQHKTTVLKVDIDAESNQITFWNNGTCISTAKTLTCLDIPVVIHESGKYLPELIFGEFPTIKGTLNCDCMVLSNILSLKFTVEIADGLGSMKKYFQTFSQNNSMRTNAIISTCDPSENFMKISFTADLARFGMGHLEVDMVELMKKRVYDVAGCNSGMKVYLNGSHIVLNDFTSYSKSYLNFMSLQNNPIVFDTIHDNRGNKWEIGVTFSHGQQQQVSFVNSVATLGGGTHVAHVVKNLVANLKKEVEKKAKGLDIKTGLIKKNIWIFVHFCMVNPAFNSPTRDMLTSKVSSFKDPINLSKLFMKEKQHIANYEELIDATYAGTEKSSACTLILTEGISAKALVVAGMKVISRDYYGVFPLRGKMINISRLLSNDEIQSIIHILGLPLNVKYENAASLRYGHIMIMADQDIDGSHIKGLIINFIHYLWPDLFKLPKFLTQFITPIVKVFRNKEVLSFFSIPDYVLWKQKNGTEGCTIKYYKGLGTSTSKEACEYFSQLDKHQKDFVYTGSEDDDALVMAFSKERREDIRQEWIQNYQPGSHLDLTQKEVSYHEFVHKELILYFAEDYMQSIPSIVDGFKPSQRKVFYSCFKRNLIQEIKVAQLAGYITEHAAYHKGEASLHSIILEMAQDFVGSNNINLLQPHGQFGTRLEGGKDAACTRYILTCLSKMAYFIFHPDDSTLLDYLDDDGFSIEPNWYVPIIPLCLVNGQASIGTGYSTTIPSFNPRDIVNNLYLLLRGEDPQAMLPWYRGFLGNVVCDETKKRYKVTGVWHRLDDITMEITELPIGKWTIPYKSFLEKLMSGSPSDRITISNYKEYNTDTKVHFIVTCPKLHEMTDEEVYKAFRLESFVSLTNMHMIDQYGKIQKYSSPTDILKGYFVVRLEYYSRRKDYLINILTKKCKKIYNKVRFISEVNSGNLVIRNRPKNEITKGMFSSGYDLFPSKEFKKSNDKIKVSQGNLLVMSDLDKDYDYLLGMKFWALTTEHVEIMQRKLAEKSAKLDVLLKRTPQDIWKEDLDLFMKAWDEFEINTK